MQPVASEELLEILFQESCDNGMENEINYCAQICGMRFLK